MVIDSKIKKLQALVILRVDSTRCSYDFNYAYWIFMSTTACSANGKRIGIISLEAFGFPGRVAMSVFPRMPAVPRDKAANGCIFAHSIVTNVIRPSHDRSNTRTTVVVRTSKEMASQSTTKHLTFACGFWSDISCAKPCATCTKNHVIG